MLCILRFITISPFYFLLFFLIILILFYSLVFLLRILASHEKNLVLFQLPTNIKV
ncbi:hypothetical protein EJ02DRAFT_456877 [Clathrospora elynae]|uniref:Uncharacterized protein n=1 Tax=Clathrospora elynae TaxID=706981 RepID=A0A6A5SIF6_9PLEO|nr:hypothetical protein EJ02DRAFT_456877 [Clathrospora elynae]